MAEFGLMLLRCQGDNGAMNANRSLACDICVHLRPSVVSLCMGMAKAKAAFASAFFRPWTFGIPLQHSRISGAPAPLLLIMPPVTTSRRQTRLTSSSRSESTEDHLERIQELVDKKGYARVADTAAALGLSRSAVSNMVRRLARRGFLNYERYRGFTLTPAGRQVAQHIKARHETLTEFLAMLGLDANTVASEVEDIEHHLRPQTLAVFTKLVSFWKEKPRQLEAFLRYSKRK
jgi:Mn-dependent DtxR family transcriptional regulator